MADDEQMMDVQVKKTMELRIDYIPPLEWSPIPNSKLVLVVRTGGQDKTMCPTKRKLLYSMRLRKVNIKVLVKADETVMLHLHKLEGFVEYGYPPSETVKRLVHGAAVKSGKKIIPLRKHDNDVEELFALVATTSFLFKISPMRLPMLVHTLRTFPLLFALLLSPLRRLKRYAMELVARKREDHIAHLISKIKIT